MTPEDLRALFDLTGRVAIVTGGTRGIGRAVAEGLCAAGAKVVVASRKADACADAEAALRATGADALGVPTHLGDPDAVEGLVAAAVERFGRLDVVVNNAANALALPLSGLTLEAWEKSLSVNLRGPVFLAKAAHPHLRESAHGVILNVISVGALLFSPGLGLYNGGKSGLLGFTRTMAAEWATDGIRVNALAPGSVDTDMVRNTGPESMARMASANLQQRIAPPEEMVGPVLFLVSDASSFVTGQVLVADGGLAPAR